MVQHFNTSSVISNVIVSYIYACSDLVNCFSSCWCWLVDSEIILPVYPRIVRSRAGEETLDESLAADTGHEGSERGQPAAPRHQQQHRHHHHQPHLNENISWNNLRYLLYLCNLTITRAWKRTNLSQHYITYFVFWGWWKLLITNNNQTSYWHLTKSISTAVLTLTALIMAGITGTVVHDTNCLR